MNQLRSWLYGHSSSHATRQDHTVLDDLEHGRQVSVRGKDWQVIDGRQHSDSSLRNALLKVIPLAPGDCLECKLVGTGVMMISGIIILTSAAAAKRKNANLVGIRGAIYYTLCGGLFLGFQTTALCRLFDWGPFNKTDHKMLEKTHDKS